MAKQDFEQFKQDVKEWLNSHPEEYDRFVAEVNNKSAKGFQIRMETHPSNDA